MSSENNMEHEKSPASAEDLEPQMLLIQMWNGRGFPVHVRYVVGKTTPESVAWELVECNFLMPCDVELLVEKLKIVVQDCLADLTKRHVQHVQLTRFGLMTADEQAAEDSENPEN